jgi:hypothetical protein
VKRALLAAAAGALTATAGLAILILLFGDFGENEGRILLTTLTLSLYTLLSLPGAILLDQRRAPTLAWTNVSLAGVGFAVAIPLIWGVDSEAGAKTLVTVTAFAAASTQVGGLTARRLAGRLFFASSGLALILASMASIAAWAEVEHQVYFRLLAALSVLDVLLVALQPLLGRLGRVRTVYRLRIFVEPGDASELEVEGADFAAALAQAVRRKERDGARVSRIERL